MKLRLTALLAILALAAFGLVACGGDDDDEPVDIDPIPEAVEPDDGEETEPADGDAAAAEDGVLTIEADPGGALAYTQTQAEAEAGTVTLRLVNESNVPHDVRIESADGEDVGGTEVITEDEDETELDLEAGEYTFYCSVGGHRAAGMEGTLTVE